MRILYAINSVRGLGGIQRVTILKMNALADIEGNEVYVAVTDNWPSHCLVQELSSKVQLIDLGVKWYADDYKSGLWNKIRMYARFFIHWKRMKQCVNRISPDVIVSVGQSEKYIIPLLYTRAVKIREVHFNSNYRAFTYSSRIKSSLLHFLDFRLNAKGYEKVVLLTKEDKETYFPTDNRFVYIHNPATFIVPDAYQSARNRTVVAVGRLSKQKAFDSLIKIWKLVVSDVSDWHLEIIGEGPERKNLEKLIKELELQDFVSLKGFSAKVSDELEKSSIFVLTSVYEGFPLVIAEAMSCGLPVVSYTCPFGPRDIVQEGINGFLVSPGDEQTFAKRIIELINNEALRNQMGECAMKRAADFDISLIIKQWMDLFHQELQKKEFRSGTRDN